MSSRIRVGVFHGPWGTPSVARDGAVLAFEDLEVALHRAVGLGELPEVELHPVSTQSVLKPSFSDYLRSLDILFCNCGPLASLIMMARARSGLRLPLIREVHTLGWVGTLFQEFVAEELAMDGDITLHASQYAADVWDAFAPIGSCVVHQPIVQTDWPEASGRRSRDGPSVKACFLSRLSADKGLHEIPGLVERLRQSGWPLRSLEVAGRVVDAALFREVGHALTSSGVTLRVHGELDRQAALALLSQVDLLLFPSTSSFEALGRVVVEACAAGTAVIAADYCGAHDLLRPEYLVPLEGPSSNGTSTEPFPVARLALDAWEPPPFAEPHSVARSASALDSYRFQPALLAQVIAAALERSNAGRSRRTPRMQMHVDLGPFRHRSAEVWALDLERQVISATPSRLELNDLGGVLKQSIRRIGFEPRVQFNRAAVI